MVRFSIFKVEYLGQGQNKKNFANMEVAQLIELYKK